MKKLRPIVADKAMVRRLLRLSEHLEPAEVHFVESMAEQVFDYRQSLKTWQRKRLQGILKALEGRTIE